MYEPKGMQFQHLDDKLNDSKSQRAGAITLTFIHVYQRLIGDPRVLSILNSG